MQHLLRSHESSLFSELKEAGYYVWMNSRNDLIAGQIPDLMEAHATEIYYGEECPKPLGPEKKEFRGQPGDKNYYSHYEGRLLTDENGKHYSSDDGVVDAAIDRILHPVDDRPLCMFLGLMYPHTPYAVEEPYFSAIDRDKLPRRAAAGKGKPQMEADLRRLMRMDQYTEQDWDELRACYLGMCMKVDDQFKRLVNALKKAGIYDDCAIFFLSDHGDYAGDYDLPEKSQNTFEDCLVKVPLLIKPPRYEAIDPGSSDSLVELVDFYATVLDYAGVEASHDHFGQSLRPVLENRHRELREFVYCEGGRMPWETQADEYHPAAGSSGKIPEASMYWPRQTAQLDANAHCKGTMIRNHRYKYVHRSNGKHELYDLQEDPLEENNVFGEVRYEEQVINLRLCLLDWYQQSCDIVPRDCDRRLTDRMMWAMIKQDCPPQLEEKAWEMIRDGKGMAYIKAQLAMMNTDGSIP
jgi:arylsulfatase A-like enzyme